MKIKGKIWKFGANIDTDAIIPGRYLNISNPSELAKHVLEDQRPEFANEVKKGDLLLARRNFGCGSSREQAPIALKMAGISCIIAESFARIFYRNAFNIGLPLLESLEVSETVQEGDDIEINLATGRIIDLTQGKTFPGNPIPAFMMDLIKDGGLIRHIRKTIKQE